MFLQGTVPFAQSVTTGGSEEHSRTTNQVPTVMVGSAGARGLDEAGKKFGADQPRPPAPPSGSTHRLPRPWPVPGTSVAGSSGCRETEAVETGGAAPRAASCTEGCGDNRYFYSYS